LRARVISSILTKKKMSSQLEKEERLIIYLSFFAFFAEYKMFD
jgi:hypothetical protein